MLENQVEFCDHLKDKEFDCNRVDGSHDENPTGLEIHCLWTKRHVVNSKTCTVVTTRHSGGSYFNRVELQNGCLAWLTAISSYHQHSNGNNYSG